MEVVGLNKVKCLWLKLDCLYIHVSICMYRIIYTQHIWIDVFVYTGLHCIHMHLYIHNHLIYTIPRYAYTIHTTPILLIPNKSHIQLRMFVCCRCPGLFCTTSSKGPGFGMGFDGMDWGNFKEMMDTGVTKENGPREKSNCLDWLDITIPKDDICWDSAYFQGRWGGFREGIHVHIYYIYIYTIHIKSGSSCQLGWFMIPKETLKNSQFLNKKTKTCSYSAG